MTQRFGLIVLALSLVGLLGMTGKVAPCDANGRDICNLERPEDIAFIPGTDWFAVSTSSASAPLVFIAAHSKRQVALALPFATATMRPSRQGAVSAPDCPGPPTRFRAGGNDIRRVGSELRMLVINHPEPGTAPPADVDRVELFTIQMRSGTPSALWRGCFPVPAPYALNDVAIGSEGEIYASHQYERTHSPEEAAAARQKFLAGTPTGFGLTWTPGMGWTAVPGTEVSFGNGVAVSLDDRLFALAGTYSQAVLLVDRRTGAVRRVPIPLTPDNITPLADGGFIVVGHTGVPVTGVDPCRPAAALPCGFPFAVARIDREGRVSVLFEHDGSRIPGASVAVLHKGELYLGSFFGDRITVLDRPPGAPRE